MDAPPLLARLADRIAVMVLGGVRVRVFRAGDRLRAAAAGDAATRPDPRRLTELVLAANPPGPGAVHLRRGGARGWRIRARGALARDHFEQRLRNLLINS